MKILVTGSAGFIGSALTLRLLERGEEVVGIDNHNPYYDPTLKERRVARQLDNPAYTHIKGDIADALTLREVFAEHKPQRVVNLAAQAGVRHSIDDARSFIQSNLVGFANVLEECRNNLIEHVVYASSSSVYGANTKLPMAIHDNVNHPVSLYAATKRSNELMAHTYSHLYHLPSTGLRFFTVYGPWGRPDMALFKFTRAILEGRPIQVYNRGHHSRDFTYIDDIVEGIIRVLDRPPGPDSEWRGDAPDAGSSSAPWRLYNIGNSRSVNLMKYISVLEEALGRCAEKEFLPMQPGDVPNSLADVTDLVRDFNYKPSVTVEDGVQRFVEWYRDYFQV